MSRAHSPTFQSLHQHHSSFSNPSVALPKSQLILQPFHCFNVTAHSPILPSLYLPHSSFSNRPIASPMSRLILQPFFCFSYITGSSLTSPGELPMIHNIIDYLFYSCYMRRQQSIKIFLKPRVLVVIPCLVMYQPFENKRGKIIFTHQTDYNV